MTIRYLRTGSVKICVDFYDTLALIYATALNDIYIKEKIQG